MQARMRNPALVVPGALPALQALWTAAKQPDAPARTLDLIQLRASQINGCSVCVDMHSRELKKAGESDERLFAVAAWRDTPYFTEAERAALALTEAVTRLSDRPDPVPDDVWEEAARHYDEPALAALLIAIAVINAWNRFNVATRQVAGVWAG
jgi:AhpD family alkylhydroperoxidase